jgi:hypothetical protein
MLRFTLVESRGALEMMPRGFVGLLPLVGYAEVEVQEPEGRNVAQRFETRERTLVAIQRLRGKPELGERSP